MSKPLKIAIAGYGVVGRRRRDCIDARDDMVTVAVCDRVLAGRESLDDGTPCFADYAALLDRDLDALFVCMTNDIAPEVTMAGLERGLHVFCEKPPGRDVQDIAEVVAVKSAHPDQVLKYGFNHRYHDSVRDALKLARSGELGRIINVRGVYGKSKFISFGRHSDWRTQRAIAGGGILLDQGIHMVDLVRLFAGEIAEIHSFVSNDFWNHDVEDNAYALMRAESGAVVMLHSTATQWRHRFSLELTFAKGAIHLSGILSGSKSYGDERMIVAWADDDDQGDPREEVSEYTVDNSWSDEIAEFAEAITLGRPIENGSCEDALKTMELVYRIYCADPAWRARWKLSDRIPEVGRPMGKKAAV